MNMIILLAFPVIPGSVILLAVCAWLQTFSQDRKRADWFTAACAIALPSMMLSYWFVSGLSRLLPHRFDLYVFAVDGYLGYPSFRVGQFVDQHSAWKSPLNFVYGICSIAMVLVFAAHLWLRSEAETIRLVKVFATTWLATPLLYCLFPVCGPQFAFSEFPKLPVVHSLHAVAIDFPANAFPSGHFANALLVAWFARHWLAGRILGGLFVVLTAMATLATGQHYALDLLASIPYVIVILKFRKSAVKHSVPVPTQAWRWIPRNWSDNPSLLSSVHE